MKTNTITLTGYMARTERAGPLILGTSGSYGNEQLRVQRGAGWEGLNIRVVFHPCGAELLVPEDGTLEVPWEATARPLARREGKIVFQGAAEERVVNTADLFYEVHSHSPAEGGPPQERTPVLSEELLKRVYEIGTAAESSAQSAQRAAFAAGQAQDSAQAAARAEEGAKKYNSLALEHSEEAAAQNAAAQQEAERAKAAAKGAALSEAHALDSEKSAVESAGAAADSAAWAERNATNCGWIDLEDENGVLYLVKSDSLEDITLRDNGTGTLEAIFS